MRLVSRVLASCLALVALSASAEPVQRLYQVREPVASQQPAERSQALQRAFDTLLLRLTGSTEALEKPAVAALRNDPQQLVSKYGYENDRLVVEFYPATTERQLREAGVSLWGFDRPLVLTWWLDETPEGSQLVAGGQGAVQELQDAAQHRGLPLMLPIADLGEQLMATPEAFAGKALEPCGNPRSATMPMSCWQCMPNRPTPAGRPTGRWPRTGRAARARRRGTAARPWRMR